MPDDFDDLGDDYYFQEERQVPRVFDSSLIRRPLSVVPTRKPVILPPDASVTEAMRAMQGEHRGCVLVTEDGSTRTRLVGIFTERDVLLKIVDRGRNPAVLPLSEVMSPDPEGLPVGSSVAWVLNRMSTGGFRHVPVVDEEGRPVTVVSVRDVVDFLVDHFPREIHTLPSNPGPSTMRHREGA